MRWNFWFLATLALIAIATTSDGAIRITAPRNYQARLMSIDDKTIYKATVIIEGDILVDRFCECLPTLECRTQSRSIIVLTQ